MRLLIGLSLLLITVSGIQAQRFRAAAVGGFNLSQIDGDQLGGFHQGGLTAGLRATAVLSDRWQFGPELVFSQEGSRRSRNDLLATDYDRIRLNFVQVPVLVYFSDWKVQVGTGLSYGRLISYRVEDIGGEDITDLNDYRPDIFSLIFDGTIFVQPNLGLNVRWSKFLNNMETEPGRSRLLGRTLTFRLIYLLGSQAWDPDEN